MHQSFDFNTLRNTNKSYCFAMIPNSPVKNTHWIPISCDKKIPKSSFICERRMKYDVDLSSYSIHSKQLPYTMKCPYQFNYIDKICVGLFMKPSSEKNTTCASKQARILNIDAIDISQLAKMLAVWLFFPQYGSIEVQSNKKCYHIHLEYNITQHIRHTLKSCDSSPSPYILCETEVENPRSNACSRNSFQCLSGECILDIRVCDGFSTCRDGSDENNCTNQCDEPLQDVFPGICESPCGLMRFKCSNSSYCIPWTFVCDGTVHCKEGDDENRCAILSSQLPDNDQYFRCKNGLEAITINGYCNGKVECSDLSDENECTLCPSILYRNCKDLDTDCLVRKSRCHQSETNIHTYSSEPSKYCARYRDDFAPCFLNSFACYPRSFACIFDRSNYDRGLFCSNVVNEINCQAFQCPGYFKCRNDYCIPLHYVCDGTWHCHNGDDELDCTDKLCSKPGTLSCNGVCVSPLQLCDGNRDCINGDDEESCPALDCPTDCICQDSVVNCMRKQLYNIPDLNRKVNALFFSGNRLKINQSIIIDVDNLFALDISYNRIVKLKADYFRHIKMLRVLSLRGNDISTVSTNMFTGLSFLIALDMRENILQDIKECGFCGLNDLQSIDLSKQHIRNIDDYAFQFTAFRMINISYNKLTLLTQYVFKHCNYITIVDVRHNLLHDIHKETFLSIETEYTLYTDAYKFCCAASNAERCTPQADAYSTCKDLIADDNLRIYIWVSSFVIILSNISVLMYRKKREKENKLSLLVQHLSVSDMLMGFYLLIIGSGDAYYRGSYAVYEDHWRRSTFCKIAGFLSMLSSEMSVYTLVLITANRIMVLSIGRSGLNTKETNLVLYLGWLIFGSLSIVPLLNLKYFNGEENISYIKHGVCFLFNMSEGKIPGWQYATMIFIVFNSCSLAFVVIGYTKTLYSIIGNQVAEIKEEITLAKKIAMVIITDCVCWIPPIVIGIKSLLGSDIDPNIAKWIALLVIPINSALNPFLYTFSGRNCDNSYVNNTSNSSNISVEEAEPCPSGFNNRRLEELTTAL